MKLAEKISKILLERIDRGYYSVGQLIPAESELAEELGVSRLTLRESIKELAARGVIEIRHGKRNKIASPKNWSVTDPELARIRWHLLGDKTEWFNQLIEARQIIEVGTCELAATRITEKELDKLSSLIEEMRRAGQDKDVEATVKADMKFHHTILRAAGNEYVTAAYAPLEEILKSVRLETSSSAEVRAEAEYWHQEIFEALSEHSPQKARHAMLQHMQQTLEAVQKVTKENQ